EERRISALPPVGDDQHDRPAAQHAAGPAEIEFVKTIADARAARPIRDRARDTSERRIGAPFAQLTRDAREPRAEREGLDAAPLARECVRHVKKEARVRLHRAGYIAEGHERSAFWSRRAAKKDRRLAERAHRLSQRGPRIQARTAARWSESTARALAGGPSQTLQKARRRRAFVGGHRRKVDAAKKLHRTRGHADRSLDRGSHATREGTEWRHEPIGPARPGRARPLARREAPAAK